MSKKIYTLLIVVIILAMITPTAAFGKGDSYARLILLHTNDFHGRLQPDSSNRGGSANMAGAINRIRAQYGDKNVALIDAGDIFFGAPAISQLLMGESTIDIYNMMSYDLAVFGNHEFDKGQDVLQERIMQSEFPWVAANVVLEGTDWEQPSWVKPYQILSVGANNKNKVRLGILGLAAEETPDVTLLGTTAGLKFKDLTETILHYYDEILAQSDTLIVVAHMGTADSGVYEGLVKVAQAMIDAGKPVDLFIGGHQHQALTTPTYVGNTAIVSAGQYGRNLGKLDLTINKTKKKLVINEYQLLTINQPTVSIQKLIDSVNTYYAEGKICIAGVYKSLWFKLMAAQAAYNRGQYQPAIGQLKAFIQLVLAQKGKCIDPAAADALSADALLVMNTLPDPAVAARVAYWADIVAPIVNQPVGYTNIDLVRNYNDESNMGDIVADSMLWKADIYDDGEVNGSVDIAFTNSGGLRADILIPDGAALPYTVTWGATFEVLPFANTLFYMDLTGAQIQSLLDQSAKLYKGILQSSGVGYYWYNDTGDAAPTAWGAYGVTVGGTPLVRDTVYRVVTNNFLATGGDNFAAFAQGTNRWDSYYDMQQAFVEYIQMLGVIDAEDIAAPRITRLDNVVTMLHTNDTHGVWAAGTSSGMATGMVRLAALINAERAHNPDLLLLDAGDTFQGNSFAYFFKDRPDNPIAGGLNLLGYDALTLGNHEFNFGPATFANMLGQLDFPILGTINLDDDGAYGFINDHVEDYINLDVDGKKVTIFGLTNPRVYRYELPTNIPGLTFYSGLTEGFAAVPQIMAAEAPDLLVGLTHMGYSPYGDEIDSDVLLAEGVAGIDVIIGGHSHTRLNPAVMVSSAVNPDGTLVAQTRNGAVYLGKVNVGFIGGEIVLREGYLISAGEVTTPDPAMATYLAPFLAEIDAYNATAIGQTLTPLDALQAFTQETNAANLQADAAVFELGLNGVNVDVHLSGAMTNRRVSDGASPATPLTVTKGDMFTLMPYENSLVVFQLTGPQIKTILERGYRNYWNYKYAPGHGGYSYYTTCMLDTDFGNQITYTDPGAAVPPDGNNVISLSIDGVPVDFGDPATTYLVSTVNYIAAGSCNFNDAGITIWPLDQIVYDTQFYVRDTVIDYVSAQTEPINPQIEGRLVFLPPAP